MAISRDEQLEALRKKMGGIDMGGSSGFWRPPKGERSTIRILPPVGEMDFFFQEVGRHYGLADFGPIVCPKFTTGGEMECPICELNSRLWKGSKADKALAGKLRVSKSFWMNIVVRDPDDEEGTAILGDPAIYTPGTTVLTAIQSLINDPEYGLIYEIEEKEGKDLQIERIGDGIDTKYHVNPRRMDCALHSDPDVVDDLLEKAKDLSIVYLTDDSDEDAELLQGAVVVVKSYDRIVSEYGIDPAASTDELESLMTNDDEEDEKPSRTSRSRRSSSSDDVGSDISRRRRRRK